MVPVLDESKLSLETSGAEDLYFCRKWLSDLSPHGPNSQWNQPKH